MDSRPHVFASKVVLANFAAILMLVGLSSLTTAPRAFAPQVAGLLVESGPELEAKVLAPQS